MKLSGRGGRLKGNGSILIAAAAPRSLKRDPLDGCCTEMMPSMPEWAPDLDNELSQLIRLHYVMAASDYKTKYAKTIRRAIDTAYAAHFRALTEFFHGGRSKKKPLVSDLTYTDVANEPTPFAYTSYSEQRLEDADKLVGHLSKARRSRTSEWGCQQDWLLMWPMIQRLLKRPGTTVFLPETLAAITEANLKV